MRIQNYVPSFKTKMECGFTLEESYSCACSYWRFVILIWIEWSDRYRLECKFCGSFLLSSHLRCKLQLFNILLCSCFGYLLLKERDQLDLISKESLRETWDTVSLQSQLPKWYHWCDYTCSHSGCWISMINHRLAIIVSKSCLMRILLSENRHCNCIVRR